MILLTGCCLKDYNLITFKPEVRREDMFEVNPVALLIFSALCVYAKQNCLPVLITSIKTDTVNDRVSASHKENRAIDVSARGWTRFQCKFIEDKLNKMFVKEGAVSAISGKPVACVYHNTNSGLHFHLQAKKGYFS